jgi:hypothetical protein
MWLARMSNRKMPEEQRLMEIAFLRLKKVLSELALQKLLC